MATTDPTASKGLSMGGSRSALPVVLSSERMRSRIDVRRGGGGAGMGDVMWWLIRRLWRECKGSVCCDSVQGGPSSIGPEMYLFDCVHFRSEHPVCQGPVGQNIL